MRHVPPRRNIYRADPPAWPTGPRREYAVGPRFTMSDPPCHPTRDHPPPAVGAEPPAADGIRWELVNRMKALIAAGQLDTPERWALAEELMFRAIEDRR